MKDQNLIYLKEKQNDKGSVIRQNSLNATKCKRFMRSFIISLICDTLLLFKKTIHCKVAITISLLRSHFKCTFLKENEVQFMRYF